MRSAQELGYVTTPTYAGLRPPRNENTLYSVRSMITPTVDLHHWYERKYLHTHHQLLWMGAYNIQWTTGAANTTGYIPETISIIPRSDRPAARQEFVVVCCCKNLLWLEIWVWKKVVTCHILCLIACIHYPCNHIDCPELQLENMSQGRTLD